MINTITRGQIITDTDVETDDGSTDDFDGWYCIKTDPWPCGICGVVVFYATVDHKIIVFPEKDDPKLLQLASWCQGDNPLGINRNPKIVEYEKSMGPCISYYNFEFIHHS